MPQIPETLPTAPPAATQKPADALLSAEDRQKEVANQTSFKRYGMTRLRTLAITLAGALIGGLTFFALRKTQFINGATDWLLGKIRKVDRIDLMSDLTRFEQAKNNISTLAGVIIGGVAGFFTGKVFNGYGAWKATEIEIQTVQEVNKDISKIIEERKTFAGTLEQQGKTITDLEQRVGIKNPPTRLEQATASPQASNQIRME